MAARRLNVEVAHELATQSARHGSRFIYISTDAVFDGVGGRYAVGDPTSPTSEYGRSKVAGERATLDADPTAIVARVNFYGWSPTGTRSVAEFFYHRLARGEVTPGFTDVVVSTIEVTLLVNALAELAIGHARGIQHVVSSESISKFDLGRRIATEFGFDEGLVEPAASSEHLSVARGADLSLDTTATAEALGRAMPGQAEGITLLREEFDAGIPAALALLAPDRPANRLLFPRTAGT